jgi:hypothetical protein
VARKVEAGHQGQLFDAIDRFRTFPLRLAIMPCSWARDYYRGRKAKGHSEGVILRGLAFKWIRIVARLWKDQIPYNESLYLERCSARRAAA